MYIKNESETMDFTDEDETMDFTDEAETMDLEANSGDLSEAEHLSVLKPALVRIKKQEELRQQNRQDVPASSYANVDPLQECRIKSSIAPPDAIPLMNTLYHVPYHQVQPLQIIQNPNAGEFLKNFILTRYIFLILTN